MIIIPVLQSMQSNLLPLPNHMPWIQLCYVGIAKLHWLHLGVSYLRQGICKSQRPCPTSCAAGLIFSLGQSLNARLDTFSRIGFDYINLGALVSSGNSKWPLLARVDNSFNSMAVQYDHYVQVWITPFNSMAVQYDHFLQVWITLFTMLWCYIVLSKT